ncbi:MAG TPA: galactose/methyl galactoside ABC transporter permease MglC [Erysipelotrichaceae bacterium]|nr:galactose/methyl galactoside ABC transporter permease MglC [Erysipelotrichaceae bacterium]HAO60532.1 galactose/methyl galactoside ABC transporter permease MglC [Erysipelotrichaceae bacterium]HBZ41663.1 galactose/methyl galactoside ABC transporter permease MglC [Erysipelotrichaceae bacterium]
MKLNSSNIKNRMIENAMYIILITMVIVVTILRPKFLSLGNFQNILMNSSVRLIIALGVSGALITRGTDLSAGRIVGVGAVIAGTLLQRPDYAAKFFPNFPDTPVWMILILAMIVTMLIGLINGLVIAYLHVPPFIATLGMQSIVYGFAQVYTRNEPIGGLKVELTSIATGRVFGIPNLAIIALIVIAFMWFILNMTKFGKYIYAIGGNEVAAEVAGVNVTFTKIRVYALAGLLYGLAGVLMAAKSGGATANYGIGYELEAIAACTIGGVSTAGGVGTIGGIVSGVLIFELLKTALQFLGVTPDLQYVAIGLVIVAAVAIDIRKYLAKK